MRTDPRTGLPCEATSPLLREVSFVAGWSTTAAVAPEGALTEWDELRLWEEELDGEDYGDDYGDDDDGGDEFDGDDGDSEWAPRGKNKKKAGKKKRRTVWGTIWRSLLAAFGVFLVMVGWSILGALRAPGTDSVSARLAEWARDHGGTPLVNLAERLSYKPPKVGGVPKETITSQPAGNRVAKARTTSAFSPFLGPPTPRYIGPPFPYLGPYLPGTQLFPTPGPPTPKRPLPLPAPAPIAPIVDTALPNEGQWQTLESSNGQPVLRATYVRADSTYTSYLSAVAWMDTDLLTFDLHPGAQEPGGGPWAAGASLPPDQRGDVVAAFNSGFRMADARGGFYLGGKTAGTMRDGAATIAFYADGHVDVGQWGRDMQMGPDILAARQNLDLIVDNGQVNPKIDDNSGNRWGATIGNALYVWRSGVGVTANGALVYAVGSRLSASTLAQLLIRAGAVRAMELDINTSWTIFIHYTLNPDGSSVPTKLLPDMDRPATVYDQTNSRDFIAARVRP